MEPKDALIEFNEMLTDRSEYEAEWRTITDWLLPSHGIYAYTTPPVKRDKTTLRVVNDKGREALDVMTSGMQAGETSPSRRWFTLRFSDARTNSIIPLKAWLDACEDVLYTHFFESNFYSIVHSAYTEYGGFGLCCIYFGSDGEGGSPFRFELSEIGTYVIGNGLNHRVDKLYRIIFRSIRNIIDEFGEDKVSDRLKEATDREERIPLLHCVIPEKYQDKPFTSMYMEYLNPNQADSPTFLRKSGFYEFPFLVPRWEYRDSTPYCSGPGERAIPYIKRLQEMEKANLMAAHKAINPPLNAPARKKGTVRTLPGGINYYDNPQEVVSPMYNIKFDFAGVFQNIQRTEQAIERIFFNDLFITATRDPNLSPLKAAEVYQRKEEQMIRFGPTIENLQFELLGPLIERGFNILGRAGKLPEFPMEYADQATNYEIAYISPLAEAQKQLALGPINTFLQAATGILQLKPEAADRINGDRAIDELADITGVPAIMLNSDEEVKQIRDARMQQLEKQRQQQEAAMAQGSNIEAQKAQSEIAKNYASAGVDVKETMSDLPQ